jgi:hypothetical protein
MSGRRIVPGEYWMMLFQMVFTFTMYVYLAFRFVARGFRA